MHAGGRHAAKQQKMDDSGGANPKAIPREEIGRLFGRDVVKEMLPYGSFALV